MQWVEELRISLGLSQGELLRIAREVLEDGALVSVSTLRSPERYRLVQYLEKMQHDLRQIQGLTRELATR